jgi:GT2 family glycosyltransferase
MEAAIVILNYNGVNHLNEYLPGIQKHLSSKYPVFVIDNASNDSSVEWLRMNHPWVQLIQNEDNLGFAKGYNKGLEQVNAPFFVLLNSDIRVEDDFVTPLLGYLGAHPKVAVVQPKILDDKNPWRFEYAGAAGGFLDCLGFPFCRGRIFEYLESDHGQYDQPTRCFWASGAAMAIRSSVFWEAKGFDERFFAHMEEIDLCWRIQNLGHEIHAYPLAKVWHLGGGTLPYGSQRKLFLNYRNNLWMILKNAKNPRKILIARFLMDGLALIHFLFKGNPLAAKAIFKAYLEFYNNWGVAYKERKKERSGSKENHSPSELPILNTSIVWLFYLRRKKTFTSLLSYYKNT